MAKRSRLIDALIDVAILAGLAVMLVGSVVVVERNGPSAPRVGHDWHHLKQERRNG